MSRPGTILIPLLGGFLLTLAAVSWRAGVWQQSAVLAPPAVQPASVEPRPSHLRVARVSLSVDPWGPVASRPVGRNPTRAEATPAPIAAPLATSPIPRAAASGLLEAPARKFARGGKADGS